MPESVFRYNETKAPSADPPHSPKMTSASLAGPGPRLPHEPAIRPTDRDTIVPKKYRAKTKLDKSSWEYIIKSGVAGGFAGCAVSCI
jgi:solute carrier family 25 (mitochondrial carrier protein), member 16